MIINWRINDKYDSYSIIQCNDIVNFYALNWRGV